MPEIEIINPGFRRSSLEAAVLDFDGTLSLIRRNWQNVMIPMMVDILLETGSGESREVLQAVSREFVTRLTGKQTIYQMIELAEQIRRRGGEPLEPLAYKRRYHDLLWEQIKDRIELLRAGQADPDDYTVPGSRELLQALQSKGIRLYLASGTDRQYVEDEVALLRLDHFFGPHVYGALDRYQDFSKAMVVRQILEENRLEPERLVGIGDGYVEIEEVKRVGGLAVGVASDEEHPGRIDDWKRSRLIQAGADIIIADYRQAERLLEEIGA